jgi:hypothetical protein
MRNATVYGASHLVVVHVLPGEYNGCRGYRTLKHTCHQSLMIPFSEDVCETCIFPSILTTSVILCCTTVSPASALKFWSDQNLFFFAVLEAKS